MRTGPAPQEHLPGSSLRLHGPHESADELAVDVPHERFIETFIREKGARIVGIVDAGDFDPDVPKTGSAEFVRVVALRERTCNAADPQLHALAYGGRHLAAYDDVGHRETTTRPQHAKRFPQHPILVTRQVDHAVRDDDVHRVVGQRNALDLALEKFDIGETALAPVLFREFEHLV